MDHIDEVIAVVQIDRDDPRAMDVAVILQRSPLDPPLRRGEEKEVLAPLEVLDVQIRDRPLIGPQFQQVDDRPALRGARHLRDLEHLHPEHATVIRKAQ